jgi:hypothetical protein
MLLCRAAWHRAPFPFKLLWSPPSALCLPSCLAGGLLGRLQAKALQRILAVAVQCVRLEVADVAVKYIQVRRLPGC